MQISSSGGPRTQQLADTDALRVLLLVINTRVRVALSKAHSIQKAYYTCVPATGPYDLCDISGKPKHILHQ